MNIRTIIHIILSLLLLAGVLILTQIFLESNITKIQLYFILASIGVASYYNFLFHKEIFEMLKRKEELRKHESLQEEIIESFIEAKLEEETITKLKKNLIYLTPNNFKEKILKKYRNKLVNKLEENKKVLEEKEHQEKISDLKIEEQELKEKLQKARYELERKTETENEKMKRIKRKLDIDKKVFYKEELSLEEIEILKNEDYEQTNEYCILRKKVVPVLIKKILNHKKSHTFLQYNILEYLKENFLDITKLEEHDTKDADVTFKYNNRYYALEIETGTLLKKSRQLAEKVQYLNTKYNNRWMFIVTNKNLLTKYKKYSLTTQRTSFEKDLQKMLKINTQ